MTQFLKIDDWMYYYLNVVAKGPSGKPEPDDSYELRALRCTQNRFNGKKVVPCEFRGCKLWLVGSRSSLIGDAEGRLTDVTRVPFNSRIT